MILGGDVPHDGYEADAASEGESANGGEGEAEQLSHLASHSHAASIVTIATAAILAHATSIRQSS